MNTDANNIDNNHDYDQNNIDKNNNNHDNETNKNQKNKKESTITTGFAYPNICGPFLH